MNGTQHKDEHGLTPRQREAVEHYVLHGNMSDAYRAAYSVKNMLPATVNRRAIDLFSVPHVAARVQEIRQEMAASCTLTRQKTLEILTRIARGKLADYLDEEGNIRPERIQDAGPELESYHEDRRVVGTGEEARIIITRKLRLRNPVQAIEQIAKMCGWDKQAGLEADGIVINLNIPEPAEQA